MNPRARNVLLGIVAALAWAIALGLLVSSTGSQAPALFAFITAFALCLLYCARLIVDGDEDATKAILLLLFLPFVAFLVLPAHWLTRRAGRRTEA